MSPSPDPDRPDAADRALWPLLAALRARWWLVAGLVLLAGVSAAVAVRARAPSYTAEAQILVTPFSGEDSTLSGVRLLRNSGDPTRDVETAITLLQGAGTDAAVARAVGGGTTRRDVHEHVALEAIGGGSVVAVRGTAGSEQDAVRLTRIYADVAIGARNAAVEAAARRALTTLDGRVDPGLPAVRRQLRVWRDQGDPTLSVAQAATAPDAADGPPAWLVVLGAMVAGGLISVVGTVLLQRTDHRVGTRAQLVGRIPAPVLAGVPGARGHHGIHMPPAVREAFRTLQIQLDLRPTEGCRRILVTSASAGDGKTTAVLNLAFALVSAGHRVVVVDFDLRKPDLGRQLGVTEAVHERSTVAGGGSLTSIMRSVPRLPPLRLVDVAGGPGDVALLPLLTTRTRAILQEATRVADYVLLDTAPAGEVGDALPLLADADDVLLVGRPGSTDDRALDTMAGLLERAGVTPTGWIVMGTEPAVSPYYDATPRRRGAGAVRTARRIVQGSG